MIPLISIYAGGVLTLMMALFHTRFYRMFRWKKEFENVSHINVRIIYSVHLALTLLLFMIGILSILYAGELSLSAGLAMGFNVGLSVFWLWRMIWQIAYFRREKGKRQAPIAILLVIIFALLFISYLMPVSRHLFS